MLCRRVSFRSAFVLAILLTAISAPSHGQSVAVGLSTGWTQAHNLDDGLGVLVSARPRAFPLRVQVEYLRRVRSDVGFACVTTFPGACGAEPVSRRTGMWTAGAALSLPIAHETPWRVGLVPQLACSLIRGRVDGIESGQSLGASGVYYGLGIGLELSYTPNPTLPWGVVLMGGVHQRMSLANASCNDCYEPYRDAFRSGLLSLLLEYNFSR
jgi:hypothetical protein